MKTFKHYLSEMKKPRWEVPAEPGSTPIPKNNVRLYHQTGIKKLSPIRKQGIEASLPVSGREKGIYAAKPDEKGHGVYGHPKDVPTIEFSVPNKDFDNEKQMVAGDRVKPSRIIGAHKKWHHIVRTIDKSPELRSAIERGEHDDRMNDTSRGKGDPTSKAIRFIKKRAKAKKD